MSSTRPSYQRPSLAARIKFSAINFAWRHKRGVSLVGTAVVGVVLALLVVAAAGLIVLIFAHR